MAFDKIKMPMIKQTFPSLIKGIGKYEHEYRDIEWDNLSAEQRSNLTTERLENFDDGDSLRDSIVGVQPMSGPTGLVFYADFKYGDDKEKK